MSVDHESLADAVVNMANNPQHNSVAPYEAHNGIVECLRAVIRQTPPFKQADILYILRSLANAPGFTRLSLLSAIDYLLEANTVVGGGAPSEYGLKEIMRESVHE